MDRRRAGARAVETGGRCRRLDAAHPARFRRKHRGVDQIRESADRVEARLQAILRGLPQQRLQDKV
jgi:hypothetical protein